MTIAAGFVCKDGVLLGSDSQFSAADKTYREKLIPCELSASTVYFALTGDEDHARSAIDDFRYDVDSLTEAEQTVSALRKKIRRAVASAYRRYIDVGMEPSQAPQFLAVISTRKEGVARLFSCRDSAIPEISTYACIGSGNYIANYIIKSANPSRIWNQQMRGALMLALHALTAARRHDMYSGGGVQFVAVRGRECSAIYTHDEDKSGEHIKIFEAWAAKILSVIGDPEMEESEFQSHLREFDEIAEAMRSALRSPNSEYRDLLRLCAPQ